MIQIEATIFRFYLPMQHFFENAVIMTAKTDANSIFDHGFFNGVYRVLVRFDLGRFLVRPLPLP